LIVSTENTATVTVGISASSAKTPVSRRCRRPRRFGAPRRDHLRDALHHQRRHDQDIDKVRQQDEPQRRRDPP
jgi:hypothetical protein